MSLSPVLIGGSARACRITVAFTTFAMASLSAYGGQNVFQGVKIERSVSIGGEVGAHHLLGEDSAVERHANQIKANEAGPDTLSVGMGIKLRDDPAFFGFADGQSTMKTEFGSEALHFTGLADVALSGYADYPYYMDGSGGAELRVSYTFNLADTQSLDLTMNSSIGRFRDDDFVFSLHKVGASDKVSIWDQTAIIDENGEEQRSFKELLCLDAGQYVLTARLSAFSFLLSSNPAARTWAQFSLTPVSHAPEPSSWALAMAGLAAAVLLRRRGRSPVSTAPFHGQPGLH